MSMAVKPPNSAPHNHVGSWQANIYCRPGRRISASFIGWLLAQTFLHQNLVLERSPIRLHIPSLLEPHWCRRRSIGKMVSAGMVYAALVALGGGGRSGG